MSAIFMTVVLMITFVEFCSVSQVPRLVCYFNSRAILRAGKGKFTVDNINAHLCTHITYVSIPLDDILNCSPDALGKPSCTTHSNNRPVTEFVRTLREKNPKLKLMVSVGNWNDGDSLTYANKVAIDNGQRLNSFAASAVEYLIRFGLHGLDFSWPWAHSTSANNPEFFIRLLKVLKREFDKHQLLLSASVSANQSVADKSYNNIADINRYADFVNLKSYNWTGSWDRLVDHHAPLRSHTWDKTNVNNVDSAVSYWLNRGLTESKLNVGIPLFGNSWTLKSSAYRPQSAASGPGEAGPFTNKPGELAFYEICEKVRVSKTFHAVRNSDRLHGPMAVSSHLKGSPGGVWTGYDDADMVKVKAKYIRTRKLGGAVVWDVSMDDFTNSCGTGTNPLLETLSVTLGIPTAVSSQRYISQSNGSCHQTRSPFNKLTSFVFPAIILLHVIIGRY